MNAVQFGNAHYICHDIAKGAFPTYSFTKSRKNEMRSETVIFLKLFSESYFIILTIEIFLSSHSFTHKYVTMKKQTNFKNPVTNKIVKISNG